MMAKVRRRATSSERRAAPVCSVASSIVPFFVVIKAR
jgi:hypothetical protein